MWWVRCSIYLFEISVYFSNTVKTADWVAYQLNDCGFPCKNLTSSVDTQIRQHLFEQYQQGEFNILSTTPMVARGLDTVRVSEASLCLFLQFSE